MRSIKQQAVLFKVTPSFTPMSMGLIMVMSVGFVGCTNPKGTAIDSSETCKAPIANAGTDSTVGLGQPVFLNASSSSWCSDYDDDVVFI